MYSSVSEGLQKKGYDISCYAKIGVYMGIKLKGDEDILVKGKEIISFRGGQGNSSVDSGTENKGGSMYIVPCLHGNLRRMKA